MKGFDQTLSRFGIESMMKGLDLQLTPERDIAVTRDGDLQLGDASTGGLYRFIERWRCSESVISELFVPMVNAAKTIEELSEARARGEGATLSLDPQGYHETTDLILEAQLVSATLAGSISVILNSLFQRLKQDVNASESSWRSASPLIANFSVGEVFSAAANNFRHYDEWAACRNPSSQQLASMKILAGILGIPIQSANGLPTIRSNVCGQILMQFGHGDMDAFHQLCVGFAKSLAKSE